jgi:hypothetical protein
MSSTSSLGRVTPLIDHRGAHGSDPLAVVFYGDYALRSARAAFSALKQVESLADGRVLVVYRHLVAEAGSWGHRLAQAVEVAAEAGALAPMHDAMYLRMPRSEREVMRAAARACLDVAAFAAAWRRSECASAVLAHHHALAAADRVQHPPTVLVGGAPSAAPTDPQALWAEVRSALAAPLVRTGAA